METNVHMLPEGMIVELIVKLKSRLNCNSNWRNKNRKPML